MNQIDLKQRVAVVTGGAQGIGKAIAMRLAESGARVAIWDRDGPLARSTAESIGRGSAAFTVEVTDPQRIAEAVRETEELLGPVSLLVNSAGISGPNAPVAAYPHEEWRRVIEVNLTGTFNINRALVPGMVDRGYGRIVNVASVAGKEGNPNAAAYSASKAGVIALTKALGKELAGHDIAVNCITPGVARTAILEQMTQEHVDYMLSKIPRGRFLAVEEIASMVVWLLSAENSFATGAAFDLSGGRATY